MSNSAAEFVSIESPYHNADAKLQKRNINYAILAVKDATKNYGNAAYASHILNTQTVVSGAHVYVSDTVEDQFGCGRDEVIRLTHAARLKADKIVFYVDFGYSSGMLAAKDLAAKHNIPVEERKLPLHMMSAL